VRPHEVSLRVRSLRQVEDDDNKVSAPDLAAQKKLAEQMQLQAFTDVPYIPLGQYFIPTAYQGNLSGVLKGSPVFWNVRRG